MGEVRRPTYWATDPQTGARVRRESEVWWIRYYRDGQRQEESSKSRKKSEAERLLKLREGAVANGEPITAAAGRIQIDSALADVVRDYRTNGKRSADDVERRIALHLLPFFGGRRMAAVTTADVRAYAEQRQGEGAANATINRELAALKRAYRLAQQGGTVLHRPHIPMLAEDNVRTGFFEREEFEAVRAALPTELRGISTFAYLTGWRVPSEILTLRWRQVDRVAKTVRLEPGQTKNGKGRTLPYSLLPELETVIETAWDARQELAAKGTITPYVFHRCGAPVLDMRKVWATACQAAGVPGRLLHDFRRTAARNLIRAGVSQTVAMQVTGHLTPSVFRRYDIVTEDDIRTGLGKLAGATGKETGTVANTGKVRSIRSAR